ncbi:MAG: TolC family protein [Proteobacteria bacterium]|nr:TolC family protein [Pseudomonadota bacterium]
MKKTLTTTAALLFFLAGISSPAAETVALSWSDCLREAAKLNPQLAASSRQIEQRRAEKRMAAGKMLPQISAQAGAGKAGSLSGGETRDNNTYSASGDQLLFDGFKTYNEFKSANEGLTASRHSYTKASSEIRYNLRRAFVDLMRAQSLVPITEGIIERRKQNLEMIKLKYESGREHLGALQLAEADLAQARYDLRKARRDNSSAQYALRKELGWEKDTPVTVKGKFELQDKERQRPDLRTVAERHPSVMALASEKRAAGYGLGSAKAEFFPRFDLSAEAGKVGFGGFQSDDGWTVNVKASLPIFEGGQNVANYKRAGARLSEAASLERSEYDTVLSGLESAWQELDDAVELCSVQEKFLKADETRAKVARAQYANGLLIFDNWIIIEDNYVRSQKSYVAAQAAMLIAEAAWIKARGEALDDE